jgi:hypothetical protein
VKGKRFVVGGLSSNEYGLACDSVKFIVIPASIEIFDRGFFTESPIEVLPFESHSKLKKIEEETFSLCNSLKSICIPSSLEILCTRCFVCCRNLSIVSFESGSRLNRIENSAFATCSSLTSFYIPALVEHIDITAIVQTSISSIRIEDGNSNFHVVGPFLFDYARTSLLRFFGQDPEVFTIDQSIEIIGALCFSHSKSLWGISFEAGSRLRRIEEGAFEMCSSLKSITIPASVEILGTKCFCECRSLLTVLFESHSQLRRIEDEAFSECTSIALIFIPASVEIVGKRCFSDCSSLSELAFESDSRLREIGERAFLSCVSLKSICIPASVTVIGSWCFGYRRQNNHGCRSLSEVIFEPEAQLVRIEGNAFNCCYAIRSICIPASVEVLSEESFMACIELSVVLFESDSHLRRIEDRAFSDCSSVKSMFIPCSVEFIGNRCFDGCRSMESLTFEFRSKLIQMGESPFCRCKDLKSILVQKVDGNSVRIPSDDRVQILYAIRGELPVPVNPDSPTILSAEDYHIATELRSVNLPWYRVEIVGHRRRNSSLLRLAPSALFPTSAGAFSDEDFMYGYDQFLS